MDPIASVVSGVAGPLFGLIDKLFTSDDERAEAKRKLVELQQKGELDQTAAALSAILAEANSRDPWTSRARPTFLYLMYLAIASCFFGGVAGIWWPDHVATAATNITNLLGAIPEPLWWLFGAGYTGYTAGRSFDKWRAVKK
ncbi:MAG: 3TM-type holin [Rhodospirillaceae bacterium]